MTDKNRIIQLLNILEEGILLINPEYRFEFINDKAKEILGISITGDNKSHESGKIQKGDIVIIADNMLGCDDGNLSPEDLQVLNIHDDNIRKGDILAAIGVYGNSAVKASYRYWRGGGGSLQYSLKENFMDFEIAIDIDEVEKTMTIEVNDEVFQMRHIYSIGFIVVIDGNSGQVKFFQDKGYSYRNETIRELLEGTAYHAKKGQEPGIELVGQSITDLNGYEELLSVVVKAMESKKSVKGQIIEINRMPVLSTIYLMEDEGPLDGVVIKIENIAELHDVLQLRNDAVKNIIRAEEHIREKIRWKDAQQLNGITGNSPYINNVKHLGSKAAKINSTVLITGESGTGKTLLAKEIHRVSGKSGDFVHVNCGAIPDNLFESELFGYVKGSFSGASQSGKAGYFELAKDGTIFLDEIGEVPINIQPKLLHVLQEKQFYKIGDTKPTATNARVIAATNVNLEEAIKEGKFRKDLYYRINVFPINIPPLRRRKQDLYVLINNLLHKLTEELEIEQKQLSGDALDKIMDYDWPGNVRELENVLERAIIISESNIIYPEHINITDENINIILKDILEAAEKKAILDTLEACNYNNKITMRKLGISKSAYYDKLKKYGISDVK